MSLLDGLSLYAICAIWLLMILNMILSIGGFLFYMQVDKDGGRVPLEEYPMVSILVPAHNESIVINDNSSDDTEEKLQQIQREFPDRRLGPQGPL